MSVEAIPEEHRRVIARWLLERAKEYRPSCILSAEAAKLITDALAEAAVDLADPESEDSTLEYAAGMIQSLMTVDIRTE